VNGIQLLERAKRFLVPGIIVLAVLFFAGGFYFHQQGLNTIPQIKTPEEGGEVSGARTSVPQNFPEDVPLFEPAEVLSTFESGKRVQVNLQTDASAERVKQFYQQEMEGFGWKLTGQGMANDNGVLTFLKSERRIQIAITSDPDSPTLVILTTSP
jgi:hypothetical protein